MLFHDPVQATSGTNPERRTVVVGGGTVGLYAACQLAARGCETILIEAGDTQLGSFASDSYSVVGRPHEGIRLARGRSLGGTSRLWGGQLVEFQSIDFSRRDWIPESGWPISHEEVASFYKPTYNALGVPDRFIKDDAVWNGISVKPPDLGSEFEVFFTRWMGVPNFAEMFSRQINTDTKLRVLCSHTATGFKADGERLTAVRIQNASGQASWIEGATFVLAAGTIENVRLLLHAGNDSTSAAPWSENRNVGAYFQDHLGGPIGSFHPRDSREFFRAFSNKIYSRQKFQPKIRSLANIQEDLHIYNTQAFFAFESEISEHLVYLKQFLRATLYSGKISGIADFLRHAYSMARYLPPLMWKYVKDHEIFIPGTAKVSVRIQCEHQPIAESRIQFEERGASSDGLKPIQLNWQIAGSELRSIRDFALRLKESLALSGMGNLEIDNDLLALNPMFLEKLGDTYHQAGGTRMAASPDKGVVDKDLRVFGTSNLYVAGASVFPTTGNANTTFLALALTTRLVGKLTGDQNLPVDRPEAIAGTVK